MLTIIKTQLNYGGFSSFENHKLYIHQDILVDVKLYLLQWKITLAINTNDTLYTTNISLKFS